MAWKQHLGQDDDQAQEAKLAYSCLSRSSRSTFLARYGLSQELCILHNLILSLHFLLQKPTPHISGYGSADSQAQPGYIDPGAQNPASYGEPPQAQHAIP